MQCYLVVVVPPSLFLLTHTGVAESELRFPGREDLMMEEEIEYKVKNIVRKVPLGTCKESATFGEELAGKLPLRGGAEKGASPNACHAYSLISDSTAVLMLIPWQAYQERLEEGRSRTTAMRTLELFGQNQRNRASYIDNHVRYYRGSRFFVDLAKHKHLNPGAYLRAAQSVQRFMDLYSAIICSSVPGHQVQHSDVQAAEAASNKGAESLDCIYRITKTPAQQKELKRLIGSMVEEMRDMLQEIRTTFRDQMRAKLEQGQAPVDTNARAPLSPDRDLVEDGL